MEYYKPTSKLLFSNLFFWGFLLLGCKPSPIVHGQHSTLLLLKHQSQENNMCVPTSASIVLDYYGKKMSPRDLKKLAIPSDPTFEGTYYPDLLKGLNTVSINWKLKLYSIDSEGFEKGLNEVISEISDGRPVLVSLDISPIGHTMVLSGYDLSLKKLFFIDPNTEYPGKATMNYDQFDRVWRDPKYNIRSAVFTAPPTAINSK